MLIDFGAIYKLVSSRIGFIAANGNFLLSTRAKIEVHGC